MEQPLKKEESKLSVCTDEDNFIQDRFDCPGIIHLAKIHGSANRALNIPCDWDPAKMKMVQFCDCCYLPEETPGIIDKFSYCAEIKSFSSCGISVYLYFFLMKFIIFNLLLVFVMSSLPFILLSKYYSNELFTFCQVYYLPGNNVTEVDMSKSKSKSMSMYTNSSACVRYLSDNEKDESFNQTDWLFQMSSDNIQNYLMLLNEKKYSLEDDNEVVINYNFINFLTLCSLLVINSFFISLARNLANEVDLYDESPSDYTLMISNVPGTFKDPDDLKRILSINNIELFDINLTWKLEEYFQYKNEYTAAKKKYEACKKSGTNEYLSGCCCCKKKEKKENIQHELFNIRKRIKDYVEVMNKKSSESFNQLVFAVFNTEKDVCAYYNLFPHSYIGSLLKSVHYLIANYICCCCYSSQRKSMLKMQTKLTVERAPEPPDVIWENLEYGKCSRIMRKLWTFLVSLFSMCMSLGIVIGLNYAQFMAKEKGIGSTNVRKYAISTAISVVISAINFIMSTVLKKLTLQEKAVSYTEFYLSFSIKLTMFTFLNSAIVPLLSNYWQHGWKYNEVLINNILIIFLSNAFASPALSLANISLLLPAYKRSRLENNKKYTEDIPIKAYSQRELNLLYENPCMDISFKYSYLAKTFMMTVFYIPIFPVGAVISFLGMVLNYLVEKFNFIYVYKKPEMLNQNLCESYFTYFKISIFVYAIGNWIFLAEMYNDKSWELINIITFGAICVIPFHRFLLCDLIGFHDDINTKDYMNVYFEFPCDYQRSNPLTKAKGMQIYIEHLKTRNIISDEEYNKITAKIQEVNVLELYYNTSANLLNKQKSVASAKFKVNCKKTKLNEFGEVLVKKLIGGIEENKNSCHSLRLKNTKNKQLRQYFTNFLLTVDLENCLHGECAQIERENNNQIKCDNPIEEDCNEQSNNKFCPNANMNDMANIFNMNCFRERNNDIQKNKILQEWPQHQVIQTNGGNSLNYGRPSSEFPELQQYNPMANKWIPFSTDNQ